MNTRMGGLHIEICTFPLIWLQKKKVGYKKDGVYRNIHTGIKKSAC